MKRIIVLICLTSFFVQGQFCLSTTIEETPINGPYYPSESIYNYNLTVWVIRRNDCSGGRSTQDVQQAICDIINVYEPIGIYFTVTVKEICNSQFYLENSQNGRPSESQLEAHFQNMYASGAMSGRRDRWDQDAINFYLLHNDGPFSSINAGYTSKVFKNMFMVGGRSMSQIDYLLNNVPSHELGHVLGLFHTFRGTCLEKVAPMWDQPCQELNDGSNCHTCGDKVCDTPPDPTRLVSGGFTPAPCTWDGLSVCGSFTPGQSPVFPGGGSNPLNVFTGSFDVNNNPIDNNNDPYIIDPVIDNVMSYTTADCFAGLTVGQGNRIKALSSSLPHLMTLQNSNGAQSSPASGTDLIVRDDLDDVGIEPNPSNGPFWTSPDIWVRNTNDGIINQQHQNPMLGGASTPYVYVRITNNSCGISQPESISLHWAKAGTFLPWPSHWDGSSNFSGTNLPKGGLVGSQTIPALQPGEEYIAEIPWNFTLNPSDYQAVSGGADLWHYCLLARIVEATPMTFPEIMFSSTNTKNNNNIASKNVMIINGQSGRIFENPAGSITIANYEGTNQDYSFIFREINGLNDAINDQFELSLRLSADVRGDFQNIDSLDGALELLPDGTAQISSLPAGFTVTIPSDEWGLLDFMVNPIVDEFDGNVYHVNLNQRNLSNEMLIGGELYTLDFNQNYFDGSIQENTVLNLAAEPMQLTANTVNQNAVYKWYTAKGTLIDTGTTITYTPTNNEKVYLKVIALADGFVDNDSSTVNVSYGTVSINPNPASQFVAVTYEISSLINAAYVSITQLNSGSVSQSNYLLNGRQGQLNIDLSNYNSGTYQITLVGDNQIISSQSLIVQ